MKRRKKKEEVSNAGVRRVDMTEKMKFIVRKSSQQERLKM